MLRDCVLADVPGRDPAAGGAVPARIPEPLVVRARTANVCYLQVEGDDGGVGGLEGGIGGDEGVVGTVGVYERTVFNIPPSVGVPATTAAVPRLEGRDAVWAASRGGGRLRVERLPMRDIHTLRDLLVSELARGAPLLVLRDVQHGRRDFQGQQRNQYRDSEGGSAIEALLPPPGDGDGGGGVEADVDELFNSLSSSEAASPLCFGGRPGEGEASAVAFGSGAFVSSAAAVWPSPAALPSPSATLPSLAAHEHVPAPLKAQPELVPRLTLTSAPSPVSSTTLSPSLANVHIGPPLRMEETALPAPPPPTPLTHHPFGYSGPSVPDAVEMLLAMKPQSTLAACSAPSAMTADAAPRHKPISPFPVGSNESGFAMVQAAITPASMAGFGAMSPAISGAGPSVPRARLPVSASIVKGGNGSSRSGRRGSPPSASEVVMRNRISAQKSNEKRRQRIESWRAELARLKNEVLPRLMSAQQLLRCENQRVRAALQQQFGGQHLVSLETLF